MLSQAELESIPRSQLVERARELGVERPERMTRVELRDEMIRRTVSKDEQAEARGLFGVARSMLASVVETGLNLPDAAKVIRGDATLDLPVDSQTPVATVTLAEIYAAQGHKSRALRMLEEVLRVEPEHQEALRVRRELTGEPAPKPAEPAVSRTAVTAPAPPVEDASTPDYVPGGFVDTVGEEIRTGKPPVVEEVVTEPEEVPDVKAVDEPVDVVDEPVDVVDEPVDVVDEPPATAATESSPVSSEVEESAAESPEAPVESVPASAPPSVDMHSPALILAQNDQELALYWELPTSALEHCGVDLSEGDAALRLVAFSPAGNTPERHERTILLSAVKNPVNTSDPFLGAGALRLPEFCEPTAVRAAIGWANEDEFLPLCVGRTVEECGAASDTGTLMIRAVPYL